MMVIVGDGGCTGDVADDDGADGDDDEVVRVSMITVMVMVVMTMTMHSRAALCERRTILAV